MRLVPFMLMVGSNILAYEIASSYFGTFGSWGIAFITGVIVWIIADEFFEWAESMREVKEEIAKLQHWSRRAEHLKGYLQDMVNAHRDCGCMNCRWAVTYLNQVDLEDGNV